MTSSAGAAKGVRPVTLELVHTKSLHVPSEPLRVGQGRRASLVKGRNAGAAGGGARSKEQKEAPVELTSVLYVADGRALVAGREDGSIAQWRYFGGERGGDVRWLRRHKGKVACLQSIPKAISGSGTLLILSGSADATIKVWDPSLRDPDKACVQTLTGHGGTVTCMVTVGLHIVSGSTDRTVRLWRAMEGREAALYPWFELQRTVAVLEGWVSSMSFAKTKNVGDLGIIYAADSAGGVTAFLPRAVNGVIRPDGSTKLDFDAAGPAVQMAVLLGSSSQLYGTALLPHTATPAVGNPPPSADFRGPKSTGQSAPSVLDSSPSWEGSVSAAMYALEGLDRSPTPTSRASSPGVKLGAAPFLSTVTKGAPQTAFFRLKNRGLTQVLYVPEHGMVLTLAYDHKLRVYDSHTGTLTLTVNNPNGCPFSGVAWDSSHSEVVLVDRFGFFFLYSFQAEGFVCNQRIAEEALGGVFTLGGRDELAVLAKDHVELWKVERQTDFHKFEEGHHGAVIALHVVENEGAEGSEECCLWSASLDNTIRQWNLHDMTPMRTLEEYRSELSALLLEPLRSVLITGHDDGALRIWNTDAATTVDLREHSNTVSCVIAGPLRRGEHLVLTGSYDGRIGLWDVRRRYSLRPHLVTAFEAHPEAEVLCLLYDSAKNILMSAGNDKVIRVWSVSPFLPLGQHQGHTEAVTCLALDANFLFSGSEDGTIRIWNTVTATYVGTQLRVLQSHTRTVTALAVLPDSGHLLSISMDGTLLVWNYTKGTILQKFSHPEEFLCMAVRRSTNEVVVGTQQHSILLFQLPPHLLEVDVSISEFEGLTEDEQRYSALAAELPVSHFCWPSTNCEENEASSPFECHIEKVVEPESVRVKSSSRRSSSLSSSWGATGREGGFQLLNKPLSDIPGNIPCSLEQDLT